MSSRVGWDMALAAMVLSFALSMIVAWSYAVTYQGMGYLRSFVQTIAMSGMVSALVMLAIGDDIARGLGMVGALTMIRFRANLKDTRDLIFVFATLAIGVACGVQSFPVAIVGTVVFVVIVFFTSASKFGSRQEFDAVLRFRLPSEPAQDSLVKTVLGRHCRKLTMIDVRSSGAEGHEFTYHLKLTSPESDEPALMRELGEICGLQDALLLKQDASLEP